MHKNDTPKGSGPQNLQYRLIIFPAADTIRSMKNDRKTVIGILAHVDAGKTTLAEGMLYCAGKLKKLGRVDHRDSFLDTHSLERQRGITIFSKQARLELPGRQVTLLDTPGHADFSAEMERTLRVLDCAVLVISGTDGVQAHTETLWRLLRRYEIPTFLFVTKRDLPGPGREELMASLRRRLDDNCVDFTTRDEDRAERLALCSERAMDCVLEGRPLPDELLAESLGMREGVAEAGAFRAHPMLEERSVLERPDLYGTAEDAASAAGDMKIFGVWSPVGRCGKTRFSLALAKEAAAQLEGRTLYLSLEVFSDMYRRTVTSGGLDISDLLYHLAEGTLDEKVWERAAANALPSGSAVSAAAVCAAANPEDVTGLGCEELRAVLDHAAGAGFAAAVVDIGSNHPRPDELLGLCDLVYAPVTDSECSKRKWEHFHAYMLAGGRAGLLDRIVTLVLPDAGTGYDSAGFPLPGEELELFVRRLPCWNA